jgi:chromosome segregation ATPase
VTTGSYLHFWSKDLENNLKAAHELVEILLKKRMALLARKRHHERDLDAHVEKVEATNKRYEILRQKLEAEWNKDLAALEEDKANSLVAFKQAEARLNEVESKLESYRIHEHNFTVDRWSLDPDSYFHK